MNHVELFAGIGGFRRAMDLISQDLDFLIQTVAYSEIDKNAITTYNANYDTEGEVAMGNIVEFVKDASAMDLLPRYELLSGGFPCQTFSMMGSQEGFEEERGQMFFRIMDMINARHPRYVLLENVKNLMRHDGGNTIAVIRRELEDAGYIVKMDVFNSNDFGLPQKRNRAIIFARRRHMGNFEFNADLVKDAFAQIDKNHCSLNFYDSTIDVLDREVDMKYYLSEKVAKYVLSSGTKNFRTSTKTDLDVARPLLQSMHKMHRAGVDNYVTFRKDKGVDGIRKLTPRECMRLMGFKDSFEIVTPDTAAYQEAGNSIVVDVLIAILKQLDITKYGIE